MEGLFYGSFGYYGQAEFRTLADKIGIVPVRRERILTQLLSATGQVMEMIEGSFLDEATKERYKHAYRDKRVRMGMTAAMIGG